MGELTFFHGLQVLQLEKGTLINQAKYTNELLKKFGIEDCSAAATLMSSSNKLDKDEGGQNVDVIAYRGLIGSLLYVTASRLDIQFAVGVCGRFHANPKLSHFTDAKWYKIDKKSTSGTCQFLGDRRISWFSKKQTSVATSTAEVEYLAAGNNGGYHNGVPINWTSFLFGNLVRMICARKTIFGIDGPLRAFLCFLLDDPGNGYHLTSNYEQPEGC
ncbi:uncharacterized protein LOC124924528 [Impatiens glandulifera]|uniref:uncharacterized protein LOC124924528 n=1 Tax=Impatiens glandulifera TaxID=253017 RepID=UPI001FB09B70|nr:uncharacterized protein LOC124924528 [Impatiens glandulifera]